MSDLDEERGLTPSDDDEFTEPQFTESQSGDYEPDGVTTDDDERPLDEDEVDAEGPVPDSERVVVMDDDLEP